MDSTIGDGEAGLTAPPGPTAILELGFFSGVFVLCQVSSPRVVVFLLLRQGAAWLGCDFAAGLIPVACTNTNSSRQQPGY
jgi:hypothetical protein